MPAIALSRLRPKSFGLLAYLVENAGRLVPKDELLGAIWPDVTVGDESLAKCISEVRAALNDSAQRLVKTVPRRGYLLDVPVLPCVPAPAGRESVAAGRRDRVQCIPNLSPNPGRHRVSHRARRRAAGPPRDTRGCLPAVDPPSRPAVHRSRHRRTALRQCR